VPRYTHLVVSAGDRSRLGAAQDLGIVVAGVRAEAHCQSVSEASRRLLEFESRSDITYAIITLRQPIEY
jgi:hypothetical protein